MTANQIPPIAADTSLADLNAIVAQTEAIIGPLIAIGNDGTNTLLIFDSDPAAPDKNAVLIADAGGRPSIPAASTKICGGEIFIAGTLTPATASRPN